MKIVGVVAEYNPLHLGHLYHLNQIRESVKPDAICCIMSGNFVQRGEPAIFDKWARTKMALHSGIDLIFELPVCFSTSTAEVFAQSAVHMLSQTNTIDYISFGVEESCNDELSFLGKLLSKEPEQLSFMIKSHLQSGITFALARERALIQYLSIHPHSMDTSSVARLMRKPNFILAIEYVKAIFRLNASMELLPILRRGASYHDKNILHEYPSASAIRSILQLQQSDAINNIRNGIPEYSWETIQREIQLGRGPIFLDDFEQLILYILKRLSLKELRGYFDVGEGLEHRIKKASKEAKLNRVINKVKTKRYSESRIRRILIHTLLNIDSDLVETRQPLYLRLMGLTSKGAKALRLINKKSAIPVITKASDYKRLPAEAKKMFERDLFSAQIYSMAQERENYIDEFKRRIILYDPR